jgi:hypothetical protein
MLIGAMRGWRILYYMVVRQRLLSFLLSLFHCTVFTQVNFLNPNPKHPKIVNLRDLKGTLTPDFLHVVF